MSFADKIATKLLNLEKSKVAAKEPEFTLIEAKIVKFCTEPRVSSSIIELFPARPHNILGIVQSLVKRGILLSCTNKYVANLEHRDFNVVMTMTASKTADTTSNISDTWNSADDLQREELLKAVNITSDYIRQYSAIDSFDLLPIWLQNALANEKKASILPADETLWKNEIKDTVANLKADNITFKDAQEMTDYLVGDKGDLTVEQKEYANQLYSESANVTANKKISEKSDWVKKIIDEMAEKINDLYLKNTPVRLLTTNESELAIQYKKDAVDALETVLSNSTNMDERREAREWQKQLTEELEDKSDVMASSKKAELDPIAADELFLYIENDGQLYERTFMPIIKNLTKKKKNNTYDSELAVKAFAYLAEEGAKKYAKDFGGTWNTMFDVPTRKQVATDFRDKFESLYKNKEYDFMADTSKQASAYTDFVGKYMKENKGSSIGDAAKAWKSQKGKSEDKPDDKSDAKSKDTSKDKVKEPKTDVKEDKPKKDIKKDVVKEKVEKKAALEYSKEEVINLLEEGYTVYAVVESTDLHEQEDSTQKITTEYLVAKITDAVMYKNESYWDIDNTFKDIDSAIAYAQNSAKEEAKGLYVGEQLEGEISAKKAYDSDEDTDANRTDEGFDDEEFNEPEDGDYVMSDSGRLGSKISVNIVNGDFLGEFEDEDSAMIAIKEQMELDNFWPNVWYQDDHGGISLRTASKKQAAEEKLSKEDMIKAIQESGAWDYDVDSEDPEKEIADASYEVVEAFYNEMVRDASKKQSTGEPEGDYDTEFFDEIVNQLANAGFSATHREFDQYQGVYLNVDGVDKFWIAEAFVRGQKSKEDAEKPYTKAVLVDAEGNTWSATRGDYFQTPDDYVFEDNTLILTKQNGETVEIENPKKSDLPDLLEVGSTFTYEKGTATEVYVFTPEKDNEAGIEVTNKNGVVDASDLVDYCKSVSGVEASKKKADSHDEFVEDYLVTALWSSHAPEEDDVEFLDEKYSLDDFSVEAVERAEKDWTSFKAKAGDLLNDLDLSQVAHDFWLTRNGHGAGFWDGDYEEEVGEKLTEISHEFGEIDVEVGDDGQLYLSGGKEASVKKADDENLEAERTYKLILENEPPQNARGVIYDMITVWRELEDDWEDIIERLTQFKKVHPELATAIDSEIKSISASAKKADDRPVGEEVKILPKDIKELSKTKFIPREEQLTAKEANDTLKDLYRSVMELSSQIAVDEAEIKRVAAEMKKSKEIDPAKALLRESIEKLTQMLDESGKIVTINAEKVLKLVETSEEVPILSETVLAKLEEMREKHRQIEQEYEDAAGAQMKYIKKTITQELKVMPLRANKIAISFKDIFDKIKNFFTGWLSATKDFGKELDAITW